MLLRRVVVPSSGLRAASLLSRAAAASPSSLSAVAPAAPAVSKPLAQRLRPRISSAPPTALRAFSAPPASCFSTSAPAFEAAGEGEAEGEAADASQCPLLEPPWQLIDLNPRERQAWADHGPALLDFPPLSKERERALERIELRRKIAKGFEERLGPEWYTYVTEAKTIQLERKVADREEEKEVLAEGYKKADELHAQVTAAKRAGKPVREYAELQKALSDQLSQNRRDQKALQKKKFAEYTEAVKQRMTAAAKE